MAGNIVFKRIESQPEKELVSQYIVNDISYETMQNRILDMQDWLSSHQDYTCIIHGEGSQPKDVYQLLTNTDGVQVLWYRSMLPSLLKGFQFFIASYEGVIQVHKPTILQKVFSILIEQAMATIYLVRREELSHVLRHLETRQNGFINHILAMSNTAFIYSVDADNFESETGIIEIITSGVKASIPFEISKA